MSQEKTVEKSTRFPEGAVMQKDGKHFHLKNEKYGRPKGKKDVKTKSK